MQSAGLHSVTPALQSANGMIAPYSRPLASGRMRSRAAPSRGKTGARFVAEGVVRDDEAGSQLQSCGGRDRRRAKRPPSGQVLPVLCNACQTSKAAYRAMTTRLLFSALPDIPVRTDSGWE
jgi:hypothetical protein